MEFKDRGMWYSMSGVCGVVNDAMKQAEREGKKALVSDISKADEFFEIVRIGDYGDSVVVKQADGKHRQIADFSIGSVKVAD